MADKENNNLMLKSLNTSKGKNIYECIKEPKPLFEDLNLDGAEYDYNKIIDTEINLTEVVMLNLFKTINSMNNKLVTGRIKDKEAEKIRIEYLKTYINGVNSFINLINKTNVNPSYSKKVLEDFIKIDDAIFKEDG